jgi:hypothetical protein
MVRKPILHSVWNWLCKRDTKLTMFVRETVRYVADHLSTTSRLPHNYVILKTYRSKPLETIEVIASNDLLAYALSLVRCVGPDPRDTSCIKITNDKASKSRSTTLPIITSLSRVTTSRLLSPVVTLRHQTRFLHLHKEQY